MSDARTDKGRIVIVLGSARSDGNTAQAACKLRDRLQADARICDLSSLEIGPFDYTRHDDRDDVRSVISLMLESEHVVFATPVYWYAMSGVMKDFFDRLSDLLRDADNRPIGRALAGRNLWLLTTGTDPTLPDGFEVPFVRTAAYFDMTWRGGIYVRAQRNGGLVTDCDAALSRFVEEIES